MIDNGKTPQKLAYIKNQRIKIHSQQIYQMDIQNKGQQRCCSSQTQQNVNSSHLLIKNQQYFQFQSNSSIPQYNLLSNNPLNSQLPFQNSAQNQLIYKYTTQQQNLFGYQASRNFQANQQIVEYFEEIYNKMDLDSESEGKYCFSIFIKHDIASYVSDYSKLFTDIKKKSHVKNISLQFDKKLPKQYKGGIINIQDDNQHNQYIALLQLIQHMIEIQSKITQPPFNDFIDIIILLPQVLIPLMMGKQGILVKKIKNYTNTKITVQGPFVNYQYQPIKIQAFRNNIKSIANTCLLIYHIVFKQLKTYSIQIDQKTSRYRHIKIGILINHQIKTKVFDQYQSYTEGLKLKFDVALQIHEQYYEKQVGYLYQIQGKLPSVKSVLSAFIQIIQFQINYPYNIDLIILNNQSRFLTSYYGKFLRDISSKSDYTRILITPRNNFCSKLTIYGKTQGKVKASCLILEFLCFSWEIMEKQKFLQPICIESQLQRFASIQGFIQKSSKRSKSKKNKKKNKNKNKSFKQEQKMEQQHYFREIRKSFDYQDM